MNMMKWSTLVGTLLILLSSLLSCSRKPAQTAPPPPEVLVTTVKPQDVPRVLERVATLGRLHQRQHQCAGSGLHRFARLSGRQCSRKRATCFFKLIPRPFEAALAQAKGTLAKDQANQVKADADKKRAMDLFNKKVISDQERDTAIAAADSTTANVEADEAAVKQAEINLGYTKITAPIDGVAGFANNQVGDLGRAQLRDHSQPCRRLIRSKLVVTAGEGPFTDFVSRHPDRD